MPGNPGRACIIRDVDRIFRKIVIPVTASLPGAQHHLPTSQTGAKPVSPTQSLMSRRQRQSAYTVIELLATVTVIALLSGIAAPGLRALVQSNRAVSQANALTAAFYLARSEAITRGLPVSVCTSDDEASCSGSDDWSSGWIVFTDGIAPAGSVDEGTPDDTVLQGYPAIEDGILLTGSTDSVTFTANGFLQAGAAPLIELRLPGCHGENQRDITINLQGRTTVTAVTC